jgi:hypothetical protein
MSPRGSLRSTNTPLGSPKEMRLSEQGSQLGSAHGSQRDLVNQQQGLMDNPGSVHSLQRDTGGYQYHGSQREQLEILSGSLRDIGGGYGSQRDMNSYQGSQRDMNSYQGSQRDMNSYQGSQRDMNSYQGSQRDMNSYQGSQRDMNSYQGSQRDMNSYQGSQRDMSSYQGSTRDQYELSRDHDQGSDRHGTPQGSTRDFPSQHGSQRDYNMSPQHSLRDLSMEQSSYHGSYRDLGNSSQHGSQREFSTGSLPGAQRDFSGRERDRYREPDSQSQRSSLQSGAKQTSRKPRHPSPSRSVHSTQSKRSNAHEREYLYDS